MDLLDFNTDYLLSFRLFLTRALCVESVVTLQRNTFLYQPTNDTVLLTPCSLFTEKPDVDYINNLPLIVCVVGE